MKKTQGSSTRQSETHREGGPGTPAEAWPIAIVGADLDAIFMISTSERHDRDPRVDIPQWGIWTSVEDDRSWSRALCQLARVERCNDEYGDVRGRRNGVRVLHGRGT